MAIDDALRALQGLTPPELAKVVKRAQVLSGYLGAPINAADKPPSDVDVDLILETISRVLAGMGVEFSSVAMLRRSTQFPAFKEKAPAVCAFVRRACPDNRVQQIAVLSLGVRLIYESLTAMGWATSGHYVMAHIHRLPSVLNQAFPGYAQAGLLGWVARKRGKDVRSKQRSPRRA